MLYNESAEMLRTCEVLLPVAVAAAAVVGVRAARAVAAIGLVLAEGGDLREVAAASVAEGLLDPDRAALREWCPHLRGIGTEGSEGVAVEKIQLRRS